MVPDPDDGYDRLSPLTFAHLQASQGTRWTSLRALGTRILTDGGSISGGGWSGAKGSACAKLALTATGRAPDFLRALKATGNVHLYACRLAAATFGVEQADLLPEADGIVDATWFLNEKAATADHCQYF
jgi:hypothetical protein